MLSTRIVKELYSGYFIRVEQRELISNGDRFEREVVTHPGAVAILPIDDNGRIGLLRQYRVTTGRVGYEMAAGTCDVADEPRLETAQRELREETGLRAENWQHLGTFLVSPGWTTQTMDLFIATGLTVGDPEPIGPEEENSSFQWFTSYELKQLLRAEPTIDATVVMSLNFIYGTFFD